MFCPNCGTQNADENQVCTKCQTFLKTTPVREQLDKRKSRTTKIKAIAIASISVICAVVIFIVLVVTHVICISHDFENATCTNPKTCKYCGKEDGKPMGHNWEKATCEKQKTCSLCGTTEGSALGHTKGEWVLTKDATLVDIGVEELACSVCGNTIDSRNIDKKTPEIVGKSFNFTDNEFLDWIEGTSSLEFVLMDTGDQNNTYAVKNTNTDGTGILILNHKKYDTDGNIRLIAMYMFDNNLEAITMVTYIGELIDSRFSSDDAFVKLYYDETYIRADMTSTMLELMDDMDFAVLTPTEYLEYILS